MATRSSVVLALLLTLAAAGAVVVTTAAELQLAVKDPLQLDIILDTRSGNILWRLTETLVINRDVSIQTVTGGIRVVLDASDAESERRQGDHRVFDIRSGTVRL